MPIQTISSSGALKESTSFGNAGYGTTLPSSPTDGMEYILVDSVSAATYIWRMRYNAGSASGFKWEYVGGNPKKSYTVAAVSSAAGSGVWSAALGTALVVPNQGEYDLRWSGHDDGNGAGSSTDFGIGFGTAPASSDQYATGSNSGQGFYRYFRTGTLAAATSLDFYIRDSDSTRRNPWSYRTLEVVPFRLA